MEPDQPLHHLGVVGRVAVVVERLLAVDVAQLPLGADGEQVRVQREEASVGGLDDGAAARFVELLGQQPLVLLASGRA